MALFMVFVLPVCWFGMMAQARQLGLPAQGSSNNNEEREEHETAEITVRDAQGVRPRAPGRVLAARPVVARPDVPPPRVRRSVTHVPEPSVLSVRRLL